MDKLELWNSNSDLFYLDPLVPLVPDKVDEDLSSNLSQDLNYETIIYGKNKFALHLDPNMCYFDMQFETEFNESITTFNLPQINIKLQILEQYSSHVDFIDIHLYKLLNITGSKIIHDDNQMLTIIPANIFKLIRKLITNRTVNAFIALYYDSNKISFNTKLSCVRCVKTDNKKLPKLNYYSEWSGYTFQEDKLGLYGIKMNYPDSVFYVTDAVILSFRIRLEKRHSEIINFPAPIKFTYEINDIIHEILPDKIKTSVCNNDDVIMYSVTVNRLTEESIKKTLENDLDLPSGMVYATGKDKLQIRLEFTEYLNNYFVDIGFFVYLNTEI